NPTTQAVYLDISGDAGTPSALTVGNITVGNGGLIVLDPAPHLPVSGSSGPEAGTIAQLSGTTLNAGSNGTVMLNGVITANAGADAIGTSSTPVKVTAGTVVATTNLGNIWVTDTIAGKFSASVIEQASGQTVSSGGPSVNFTTTSGALTVASAANTLVPASLI